MQGYFLTVFDLFGIRELTPVVSQDNRKQPAKVLCAKDSVERIKYPDNGIGGIYSPQEGEYQAGIHEVDRLKIFIADPADHSVHLYDR